MAAAPHRPTPPESSSARPQASELGTKAALFRCVVGRPATRLLLAGIVTAAAVRFVIGGWGAADAVVVAIAAVLIGPMEWLIHRKLFHAPVDSARSRRLGTGDRHRQHHQDPSDLEWLLLDIRAVVRLMVGVAVVVAIWAAPVGLVVGGSWTGALAAGVVAAWLALAHYEWTHLLIHARYGARTRRYRRLTRNHLAHHHRDAGTWFGVTTNIGDRVLGTAAAP